MWSALKYQVAVMTSITDYQQQSQSQPKQTWGYLEQEGR